MSCPPARDSKEVEECESLVIDIPDSEWALIKKKKKKSLEKKDNPEWAEWCIYRVPNQLRKVNEEAYTPKLVSIGPLHHRVAELKDMEKHKRRYLKHFLERTQKSEEDLRKIIEDNELKIRHSYSEDCGLESGDDFVKMILLDAIFIIELFLKDKEKKEAKKKGEKKESDYILSKPWLKIGMLHDLILLENQLPFFVLEKLYMFACCDEDQQIMERDTPFVELSRKYFRRYDQQQPLIVKEVKHFTDLLRYFFYPSKKLMDDLSSTEETSNRHIGKWSSAERGLDARFCAKKLDDAGLKFKAVKGHSRGLLDISVPGCAQRFSCFGLPGFIACLPCIICLICFPCLLRIQRTLEVPQLVIDDDTEAIFRNLMALEQCHYPSETFICSYILLLDRLVDTEKDVELLVDKEVIANDLGSNAEVASLINKLCKQINVATTSSYDRIARKINKHYEFPLNHSLATLKREYFPNIFRGTATVVGLIVLGFTLWNFLRPFVV